MRRPNPGKEPNATAGGGRPPGFGGVMDTGGGPVGPPVIGAVRLGDGGPDRGGVMTPGTGPVTPMPMAAGPDFLSQLMALHSQLHGRGGGSSSPDPHEPMVKPIFAAGVPGSKPMPPGSGSGPDNFTDPSDPNYTLPDGTHPNAKPMPFHDGEPALEQQLADQLRQAQQRAEHQQDKGEGGGGPKQPPVRQPGDPSTRKPVNEELGKKAELMAKAKKQGITLDELVRREKHRLRKPPQAGQTRGDSGQGQG